MINLAIKAIRELGFEKIWLFLRYQFGLRTGYLRWVTRNTPKNKPHHPENYVFQSLFELPEREKLISILGVTGQKKLVKEANEIAEGRVRLFGDDPLPLNLIPPDPLQHWTINESNIVSKNRASSVAITDRESDKSQDIKFIWEPCRFGWAFTLGRAYFILGDEKYAAAFWKYTEVFLDSNPPYLGPNWSSGQEVALRLIAFVFCLQIFNSSRHSTPERLKRLTKSIADHATRIPPTLIYARAQNNNHLLSEAAGLYTAGLALPKHPQARKWRRLGWKWFNLGIQNQILEDGAYIQHSTNYHRLMLQLALWMNRVCNHHGERFPDVTLHRLKRATHWLFMLLDPTSGQVPNLGPNDGAYILPLTNCPFEDFRPVIQSAAISFLGISPIQPGFWDEMGNWMGASIPTALSKDSSEKKKFSEPTKGNRSPTIITAPDRQSWAYLRTVRFTDRPGHADQLHLDLWWRGMNIAQDAGTFLYNAPPPWENALAHTEVHNTLLIERRNQMTCVGRFLFLDWAQGKLISVQKNQSGATICLIAEHDGYRNLGLKHRRAVCTTEENGWLINDQVLPIKKSSSVQKVITATLHWLLPDWSWYVNDDHKLRENFEVNLESPRGTITLSICPREEDQRNPTKLDYQMARAGKLVYGQGSVSPIWGWSSPTYGVKIPALSLRVTVSANLPVQLISQWSFPSQLE